MKTAEEMLAELVEYFEKIKTVIVKIGLEITKEEGKKE